MWLPSAGRVWLSILHKRRISSYWGNDEAWGRSRLRSPKARNFQGGRVEDCGVRCVLGRRSRKGGWWEGRLRAGRAGEVPGTTERHGTVRQWCLHEFTRSRHGGCSTVGGFALEFVGDAAGAKAGGCARFAVWGSSQLSNQTA